ncbi:hypothetical protein NDU88_011413 [Pleurodeles waltl]|uniref:Uncharacterized protein n=1 Tax=Pleurodeles waltl TaxID=8319 RepID=A0AAV7R1B2_PLEWA|nr:hypothetical protein NDU88_011413 [Pleurodeles waltl]
MSYADKGFIKLLKDAYQAVLIGATTSKRVRQKKRVPVRKLTEWSMSAAPRITWSSHAFMKMGTMCPAAQKFQRVRCRRALLLDPVLGGGRTCSGEEGWPRPVLLLRIDVKCPGRSSVPGPVQARGAAR